VLRYFLQCLSSDPTIPSPLVLLELSGAVTRHCGVPFVFDAIYHWGCQLQTPQHKAHADQLQSLIKLPVAKDAESIPGFGAALTWVKRRAQMVSKKHLTTLMLAYSSR
jgi:hypothetical protein